MHLVRLLEVTSSQVTKMAVTSFYPPYPKTPSVYYIH